MLACEQWHVWELRPWSPEFFLERRCTCGCRYTSGRCYGRGCRRGRRVNLRLLLSLLLHPIHPLCYVCHVGSHLLCEGLEPLRRWGVTVSLIIDILIGDVLIVLLHLPIHCGVRLRLFIHRGV